MSDLLAEHLLEIRALRQRLEETIYNNDRLREQLERRLGEVERDPGTHTSTSLSLCSYLHSHTDWLRWILTQSILCLTSSSMMNLAATNIFIHGTEEQGQLTSELRFLWGQNQALKEQLNLGSRGTTNE